MSPSARTTSMSSTLTNSAAFSGLPSSASTSSAIETASSITDIRAALSTLHARETTLSTRLDALLNSHTDLYHHLILLDSLRATLSTQTATSRSISNPMLASAAKAAGGLRDRVRALDLEKSRVEDTLRVVEQMVELKACVAGVVGSMGAPQDWEAAAGYIARASRIPNDILRSGFAVAVTPTVEAPDAPAVTLERARESLSRLFLKEFEKAAKDGDGERAMRFFKLFPLIDRMDVGLDAYGRYVRQGVAGTARAVLKEAVASAAGKNGFFYADALTKLFEHIAQIVDGHEGLVERHYGQGKMVRVIEQLQMEADVQGGIILDTWSDERAVDRVLTDVKSRPSSLLAQGFLPPQKGKTGASRTNSPALSSGPDSPRNGDDEGAGMKGVDALLSEIAVMLGRWSLYVRFIAKKCTDGQALENIPLAVPEFLTRSNLHRKVSMKLMTPYNIMSTFFLQGSIEKAFQLDEAPSGLSLRMSKPIDSTPPHITSAVDDIMYIVKVVIQWSLSTSQREVMGSVIPTIGKVLGNGFVGILRKKMYDEPFPQPVVQGAVPPEAKIISYIVLINNLDMANEYLARILSSSLGTSPDQLTDTPNTARLVKKSFPFERDAAFVTKTLCTFSSAFSLKTAELCDNGIQGLFNQVVKPRLRLVMNATFRGANYTLSEEEFIERAIQNDEDEEQLDQVPRRFEHGWDGFIKPIARIMTPRTFTALLDITVQYLSRVLENRVWSYVGRITAYGAIHMESGFGGIVEVVARDNYVLREVFGKTVQILAVASMEEEEWQELLGDGEEDYGMIWVLSEEERKRARSLVRT